MANHKLDLEALAGDEKKINNIWASALGEALSNKASHNSRNKMRQRLIQLHELYPEVVENIGEGYKKYLALIDKKDGEKKLEEMEKERLEEIEANKPWDLIVAEKYVYLHKNAVKRNKEFNLTYADIDKLMSRKTCFYTGVRLHSDKHHPHYRTIDRVDPSKGYVKGNVVACSHLSNQIKNRLFEEPTSNLKTNMKFMLKMITKLEKVGFEV